MHNVGLRQAPSSALGSLSEASPPVASILSRLLGGDGELTTAEATVLLQTTGKDLRAVTAAADEARRAAVGDTVTYVVNR